MEWEEETHSPLALSPGSKEPVARKPPKTRFGCVTCKARRVKCDETKPACNRCLKFWGRCEGYPTSLPPIHRKRKKGAPKRFGTLPLLPRPDAAPTTTLYPSLSSMIDELSFASEQEYHYFLVFKNQTITELPGVFGSDLWDRIILQACHQEEFVRDAAVAIGALSSCGREFVERAGEGRITGSRHYRFALAQYGRAIRKMRESLENGKSGLRMALLACLLVVCFEGLQGNVFQALEHAVAGGQLLRDWIEQQEFGRKENEGICSPKEGKIEDEIVNAFGRLDLQVMGYVDPRPWEVHKRLKDEGSETVARMPALFESVREARLYWELVHRRASHFIATIASAKTENPMPAWKMKIDLREGSDAYPPHYHAEEDIYRSFALSELSGENEEYLSYSAEIARWFVAFTPFYETLPRRSRAWTAASLVYVHAKATEIMLLSSLFEDECSLDSFLPHYKEIVSCSREILLDPLFHAHRCGAFIFDRGLVNPLRLVGRWCRDGIIRREAIRILKQSAMREGLCDGLIVAKLQEWLMGIEEEGLKIGEFIPEERRAKILGVRVDCFRRFATVRACRIGLEKDERTMIIKWGVEICPEILKERGKDLHFGRGYPKFPYEPCS